MVKDIVITHRGLDLKGRLSYPNNSPKGWIIFAHGSGSSHKSPRNNWVANELNRRGFGTLLFDLLTEGEDEVYENRFNIPLLGERLIIATQWLLNHKDYNKDAPFGYFGASTGAGAALVAAAKADYHWPLIAVVSRGGRPDLAGPHYLKQVRVPTLLIVGDQDFEVIRLNIMAQDQMENAELRLIPGATHLFEEPGTLNQVVKHTIDWFETYLRPIPGELSASP